MARTTPTLAEAEGMLSAIKAGHSARACEAMCKRGCTWDALDVNSDVDRRIIGSVYAADVRYAMGRER